MSIRRDAGLAPYDLLSLDFGMRNEHDDSSEWNIFIYYWIVIGINA